MANQVPSEVVETLYQIAGGDYAGVIGRLRTNERIAKFVTMFADDASYTNLIDNMAAENWDEAFRAAHTLKGTARDIARQRCCTGQRALTCCRGCLQAGCRRYRDVPLSAQTHLAFSLRYSGYRTKSVSDLGCYSR